MDTSYDTYIHNHMPNTEDIAPANLFTETECTRHKIRYIHVWGFTVYTLYPRLQQGGKPSKWQLRSFHMIFVWISPNHLIDVPLILNLYTGHISPQFLLIFDDSFITVFYFSTEEEPPSLWNEFYLDNFLYSVTLNYNAQVYLDSEWLTPDEL